MEKNFKCKRGHNNRPKAVRIRCSREEVEAVMFAYLKKDIGMHDCLINGINCEFKLQSISDYDDSLFCWLQENDNKLSFDFTYFDEEEAKKEKEEDDEMLKEYKEE